jgi:hypothetical protein
MTAFRDQSKRNACPCFPYSRFVFWFFLITAGIYGALLARSYQLRSDGIDLIRQGDHDKLEQLVRGRPGLATELLGYAYESKQRELFELLFSYGANVNVAQLQTEWGPYPLLHHFAREPDIYWLKASFAHGGNPNARSRFGITPLSEAIAARRSANVMEAIEAGANIHGQLKKQPYFDKAVEALLFEPAYRMLEMGVDPSGTLDQFPNAVLILRNCCTGLGLDEETVIEARKNKWFQKIIEWYRERDRDIANATYEPSGENRPGKWRIPSFSERKDVRDTPP